MGYQDCNQCNTYTCAASKEISICQLQPLSSHEIETDVAACTSLRRVARGVAEPAKSCRYDTSHRTCHTAHMIGKDTARGGGEIMFVVLKHAVLEPISTRISRTLIRHRTHFFSLRLHWCTDVSIRVATLQDNSVSLDAGHLTFA